MKYTIHEKLAALWDKLTANRLPVRMLALLLALALLQGDFMLSAYATESEGSDASAQTSTPEVNVPSVEDQTEQAELPVDEETLFITLDGVETSVLELFEYEKVEIRAEGLEQQADYQWQILHPENGTWVNIYDATEQSISVSAALVKNMLNEDGSAALRCRAYTEEYAYLTDAIRVTLLKEPEAASVQLFSLDDEAVPMADGDSDLEFATVTIEYKLYGYIKNDVTGKFELKYLDEAFSPYVATLKAGITSGETERIDVASPTVVGYDRFWTKLTVGDTVTEQPEGTSGDVINIPLTNVTENIVYTVEYRPAQVRYKVHYFFQNVYDDLYVEDTSMATPVETTGYTGTEPDPTYTERVFDGFTSLYYEPETIAADGSTVFQVYYERNYHLMEFDCNGGYGADTIYVRYGTYISVPNPSRMGYAFAGWNKGTITDNGDGTATITYPVVDPNTFTGITLPSTMPHENTIYQAVWRTIETKYTVVYWLENANPEADGTTYEYSYLGSESIEQYTNGTHVKSNDEISAADHTTIPSTITDELDLDDQFFSYNESKTLQEQGQRTDLNDAKNKVIVQGDGSTVLNVYFSRATYTLKFYYAIYNESTAAYSVVGGSSHYFGTLSNSSDRASELALMSRYITDHSSELGTVDELPTLNAIGNSRNYNSQYDTSTVNGTRYRYHYISFNAKYDADISALWPCGVFNSVTRTSTNTHGYWSGTEAFVSAWNGEYNVEYTLDETLNHGNQTIKGKFAQLNDALLWRDMSTNTDNTISFLCFWENGANIWWSVPELYRYNIYLECVDGIDYSGKTTDDINGVTYYLADTYDTCDDSTVAQQTQPGITGYTAKERTSETIADFDTSLYKEAYNVNFYYTANSGLQLIFSNYNQETNDAKDGEGNPTKTFATSEMKFAQPLSAAAGLSGASSPYQPGYPIGIEPGAFQFVGWYTSPEFVQGTLVDWTTDTMPDSNLRLYANWERITRKVYFHLLYTDIDNDNDGVDENVYWDTTDRDGNQVVYPIEVSHGTLLGTTYNYLPTREGYDFIGWFYMDEDNKKKFAPDSMEIRRDLHLFAEWHSQTDTEYEVKYTLAEDETIDGITYTQGKEVGALTTGHSSAGKTKTFTAKARSELDLPFSENSSKLYPTLNSHSILMSSVKTENQFSFTYIVDEEVWYKIRYLNKIDNSELHPSVTLSNKDTNEDIITAKFVPIEGYLPEKYYIRKVLAADGDAGSADNVSPQNEIIFYYTPDTEHALYTIEYYLEKVDSTDSTNRDNYERARSIVAHADLKDASGNPTVIEAEILDFTGFSHPSKGSSLFLDTVTTYTKQADGTYVANTPTPGNSGELSIGGLEIRVYYQRISYPYTIQFVEYGNPSNVLGYGLANDATVYTTTQTGSAMFESSFSYTAPDSITKTVGGNQLTYLFYPTADKGKEQTLKIRATDTGNVLTFYYEVKKTTIQYEARCTVTSATGYGEVSMNRESAAIAANLAGANAMPGDGFKFEGWYNAETGSKIETSGWVTGPDTNGYYKLKPLDFSGDANDDGVITYYALFEPVTTSLHLTKTVTDIPDGMVNDDTFLFLIEGHGKHTYLKMTVAVPANSTVTIAEIPIDEYKITELTGWSWEYSKPTAINAGAVKEDSTTVDLPNAAITFTIVEQDTHQTKNNIQFTNQYVKPDWLGGESAIASKNYK